ncbi:MAG: rod shape-determining protein MreD [Pseudomonadota bacterium]
MKHARRGAWVVIVCFSLSLLLTVVPLPDWLDWFRPSFALLGIVFWSTALPERYGTWSAWWLGLLFDVLLDAPLGAHALAFSVAGFAASRLSARMKVYPMPHQMIAVGVLCGVSLMVLRLIGNLTGTTTSALLPYLLPVVTTALLWPWAQALQDRLRRAFGVN